MFNKHLKQSIKRLLTLTLATTMLITSINFNPTHVHADGTGGVKDSAENDGTGKTTSSSTDNILAYTGNTRGYRMYIINQDLIRITPVYDFYNKEPMSVYSWLNGGVDEIEYETSTRFDGAISPSGHIARTLADLKAYTGSSESVPLPTITVNGKHEGNGAAFKEWFTSGKGSLGGGNDDDIFEQAGPTIEVVPTGTTDGIGAGTTIGTQSKYTCNTCKDTGFVWCDNCNDEGQAYIESIGHTGYTLCGHCGGNKYRVCTDCYEDDNEYCWMCYGKTTVTCEGCKGTGECSMCNGDPFCDTCYGIGLCTVCSGSGATVCKQCSSSPDIQTSKCSTCGNELNNCTCKPSKCQFCGFTIPSGHDCTNCNNSLLWLCSFCGSSLFSDGWCSRCNTFELLTYCTRCSMPLQSSNYKQCTTCNTIETQIKSGSSIYANGLATAVSIYNANMFDWLDSDVDIQGVINNYKSSASDYILFGLNEFDLTLAEARYYACRKVYNELMNSSSIGVVEKQFIAILVTDTPNIREDSTGYSITSWDEPSEYGIDIYYINKKPVVASPGTMVTDNSPSNTLDFYNNPTNLLYTPIPLAGNSPEDKEEKAPAEILVQREDMFTTVVGYEPTYNEDKTLDKSAATVALEDGCLLIVEPLTGLYAQVKNGDYHDPDNYTPNRIYGSYWNIMSHWQSDGSGTGNRNGGFYTSFVYSLYPYCLLTSVDITTRELKDESGNKIGGGKTIFKHYNT